MDHLRRAGAREIVVVAVSILVIAFAGWYLRAHWMGTDPPPAGQVSFYCPQCQYRYQLTNVEFDSVVQHGDFQSPTRGSALYKCPKCKQYAAQISGQDNSPPPVK